MKESLGKFNSFLSLFFIGNVDKAVTDCCFANINVLKEVFPEIVINLDLWHYKKKSWNISTIYGNTPQKPTRKRLKKRYMLKS